MRDITDLLAALRNGDRAAMNLLLPLVYDELRRRAHQQLGRGGRSATLSTTGLVHEAYLKLVETPHQNWEDRGHFFGVSAQMMRRVLVDIARRRRAERRGGAHAVRIPIDDIAIPAVSQPDLLDIDAALDRLAAEDPRKARVVELRFFGGLSVDETAEALQISVRTVHKDWAFARAWLYRALAPSES